MRERPRSSRWCEGSVWRDLWPKHSARKLVRRNLSEGECCALVLDGRPTEHHSGNGPVGISAGLGSQFTIFNSVQIADHTGPAVDLYANSQAFLFGQNQILRNGTAADPLSAAIRIDGNSQALLRGGDISQNNGPAILGPGELER